MSRKRYKSVCASIHNNLKTERKIYKLWKVDDRLPILQLARSRWKKQNEAKIWVRKDDKINQAQDKSEKQ